MSLQPSVSRATVSLGSSPSWVTTHDFSGWSELFRPEVNLVLHAREVDPQLAAAGEELANAIFFNTRCEVSCDTDEHDELTQKLAGMKAIADDLHALSQVLGDLVGARRVGVRVAKLAHAMCPGFHVDRVLARVVVTYAGPCTEWLSDHDADRSALATRARPALSADAGMRAGAKLHSARPFDAVLCRGASWPNAGEHGVVHRSPAIPHGANRIVATLDPLD